MTAFKQGAALWPSAAMSCYIALPTEEINMLTSITLEDDSPNKAQLNVYCIAEKKSVAIDIDGDVHIELTRDDAEELIRFINMVLN